MTYLYRSFLTPIHEARSVVLQRTMSDFSVIATDLLPAHAWNVLPKTGLW